MKWFVIWPAALLLMGCECEDDKSGEKRHQERQEFVSAGQLDVRGTWYETGFDGGWGPRNDWGFSWLYIRQYGSDIHAAQDQELYDQGTALDFDEYVGTLEGSHLILTGSDASRWFDLTVSGNTLKGFYAYLDEGKTHTRTFKCDRVNTAIVRFADPDNGGVDWRDTR
jgi:hypothetical protein